MGYINSQRVASHEKCCRPQLTPSNFRSDDAPAVRRAQRDVGAMGGSRNVLIGTAAALLALLLFSSSGPSTTTTRTAFHDPAEMSRMLHDQVSRDAHLLYSYVGQPLRLRVRVLPNPEPEPEPDPDPEPLPEPEPATEP